MKRLIVLVCLVILLLSALYERPVSSVSAVVNTPKQPVSSAPVPLPWPDDGQAAIGGAGYGLLASHNSQTAVPIASTAKIITALAVLQKKPIPAGSQGPSLTLTQSDVDLFNKYYLNDGSVAQVQAGEQITEYQALEGMLLPSANNLADSLAIWAFGSIDNYLSYANKMVSSMGMTTTTVGDATGFDDATYSTADDMVKLGLAALRDPTITAIAQEQSAALPVGGTVRNINWLLGQDGVIGLKTGNTDKAGGCYLFAARRQVLGRQITLVGAVLGDTDLTLAMHQADVILKASDAEFTKITAIQKGQILGRYEAPWSAIASVKAGQDLSLLVWKGQAIKISSSTQSIQSPASSGFQVGTVTATAGQQSATTPLILAGNLPAPSLSWRIFHR